MMIWMIIWNGYDLGFYVYAWFKWVGGSNIFP